MMFKKMLTLSLLTVSLLGAAVAFAAGHGADCCTPKAKCCGPEAPCCQ
jgi:hypothetical protein